MTSKWRLTDVYTTWWRHTDVSATPFRRHEPAVIWLATPFRRHVPAVIWLTISQQAHNDEMASHWRRCDVITTSYSYNFNTNLPKHFVYSLILWDMQKREVSRHAEEKTVISIFIFFFIRGQPLTDRISPLLEFLFLQNWSCLKRQ